MASWEEELCEIVERDDLPSFRGVLDKVGHSGNVGRVEWKAGRDPWHSAARLNRDEMIKLFVEAGVNVNSFIVWDNGDRCTALHLAVHQDNASTVRLLLDLGADARLNGEMLTPFVFCLPVICVFMCNSMGERYSGTPLVWAQKAGHHDIIKMVEQHSVTPITAASSWETDLLKAMLANNISAVKLILSREEVKQKGNLDRDFWHSGHCPLQVASLTGKNEMIRLLVEAGANANSFAVRDNGNRYTALHAAAKSNQLITARLLLGLGADPTVEGSWEQLDGRPAEWARQNGYAEMVRLLELNASAAVPSQTPFVQPITTAKLANRSGAQEQILKEAQAKLAMEKEQQENATKAKVEKEKAAKDAAELKLQVDRLMQEYLLEARGSKLDKQMAKLPKLIPSYRRFKSLEQLGKIGKQVNKIEKEYEETLKRL